MLRIKVKMLRKKLVGISYVEGAGSVFVLDVFIFSRSATKFRIESICRPNTCVIVMWSKI